MNWTIDKPTVPGWYWYRPSTQESQVLMSLPDFEDTIRAGWPSGQAELVTDVPGEWSGPPEQPI